MESDGVEPADVFVIEDGAARPGHQEQLRQDPEEHSCGGTNGMLQLHKSLVATLHVSCTFSCRIVNCIVA